MKLINQSKPAADCVLEHFRYRGKKRLSASDRYKFLFEDDETFALIISNVGEDDMTKWKCVATNDEGDNSSSAKLIITGWWGLLIQGSIYDFGEGVTLENVPYFDIFGIQDFHDFWRLYNFDSRVNTRFQIGCHTYKYLHCLYIY